MLLYYAHIDGSCSCSRVKIKERVTVSRCLFFFRVRLFDISPDGIEMQVALN